MTRNRSRARSRPTFTQALGCFVALLVAASVNAAERERQVRDVTGFDRLEVAGRGDLVITQGDRESLVIEAEPRILERITTVVDGGVLKIGRSPGAPEPSHSPIRFELTVRSLEDLHMTGSASATLSKLATDLLLVTISGSSRVELGQLRTQQLNVVILGSGEIEVKELTGAELATRIEGSGSVRLAGKVIDQIVEITGSGDLHASALESSTANVTLLGSGDAEVWAATTLNVQVMGSGGVRFRGTPSVNSIVTGSGRVQHTETDA